MRGILTGTDALRADDDSMMTSNPYESPTRGHATSTKPRRWLMYVGASLIILAFGCTGFAVFSMIRAFNEVAASENPSPAKLAEGISSGRIVFFAAVPLAIAGIVMFVMGLLGRRSGSPP